jgi:C1A family cysteine protease
MAKKKKSEKRILNCIPSRDTNNDWLFEHSGDTAVRALAAIPVSKDLRESWWKIGNQGSTGSCVGWASADSVLRWHFVKAGRLTRDQKLSVRFQWMASKETDVFTNRATTFIEEAGTSLKAALDIARKYGSVPDGSLPFTGNLSTLTEQAFYAQASTRKISSYFNLVSGSKLNNFRNWLANNGPIITRLDVDSTWDNVGSDGKLNYYDSSGSRGGHAVALVGYTRDHFIIRNSWGTGWGHNGFAYASNAYANAAFTEAYGVKL